MTNMKTVMLQKVKSKGNILRNYRSITCLPVLWRLMICIIADKMHGHENQQYLFLEEQKNGEKGQEYQWFIFSQ